MRKYISKISRRSAPYDVSKINPEEIKNILIVRQHNQLGDMLCSVPLFAALRKRFARAHVTLVASPINYEILYSDINPYIDEVITYRKSSFKELKEFYRFLKNRKYQIGIVPSTVSISRTSHYINFISGAKIRVGVRSIDNKYNKVENLLNVKKDFCWDTYKLHQVERNLDIGRQINCDLEIEEKNGVRIHLSEEEKKYAKEIISRESFRNKRFLIGVHPGAGKKANVWKPENFIELVKRLSEKLNAGFIITAGTVDKEITSEIAAGLRDSGIDYLILENTPIRKVGAVLKMLDLYITNDTGTMHVAGGVDAKLLALFGPTHGYEWAPAGKDKYYIQSPTSDINDITVDKVYEKAAEILTAEHES